LDQLLDAAQYFEKGLSRSKKDIELPMALVVVVVVVVVVIIVVVVVGAV
jgi:hypothetical protein